jgi:hypothetical protein
MVLIVEDFREASPISTELLSFMVLVSVAPLSSSRRKKVSSGGPAALTLSAPKRYNLLIPQFIRISKHVDWTIHTTIESRKMMS